MAVIISPTRFEALRHDVLNATLSEPSIDDSLTVSTESVHTEIVTEKQDETSPSLSFPIDSSDDDESYETFSDSTNTTIPTDIDITVDSDQVSILPIRTTSRIDVDDAICTLGHEEELLSGTPEREAVGVPTVVSKTPHDMQSIVWKKNECLHNNLDEWVKSLTEEELQLLYKGIMRKKSMQDEEIIKIRDDNTSRIQKPGDCKLEKSSARKFMFKKVVLRKKGKTFNDQLGIKNGCRKSFCTDISSSADASRAVADNNASLTFDSHKNQTDPSFSPKATAPKPVEKIKGGHTENIKPIAWKKLSKYLELHADRNNERKKFEKKKECKKAAINNHIQKEQIKNETIVEATEKMYDTDGVKRTQSCKHSVRPISSTVKNVQSRPPSNTCEAFKASDLISKSGATSSDCNKVDLTDVDIQVNENLSSNIKVKRGLKNQRGRVAKVPANGGNHQRRRGKNLSIVSLVEPSKKSPVVEILISSSKEKGPGRLNGNLIERGIGSKATVSDEITMSSSMSHNLTNDSGKSNTWNQKDVKRKEERKKSLHAISSSSFKSKACTVHIPVSNYSDVAAWLKGPKSQRGGEEVDDGVLDENIFLDPLNKFFLCGAIDPNRENKWLILVEKSCNQMFDYLDHTPEEAFKQMSAYDYVTTNKTDREKVSMNHVSSRYVNPVARKTSSVAMSTRTQSVPLNRHTRSLRSKKSK